MARKRTPQEPGIPQVLQDMRCAYNDEPQDDDRETVKEFRDMRKSDTKGFHMLMARYEDQWADTKAKLAPAAKSSVSKDPCDILVGKMLDDWDARRARGD